MGSDGTASSSGGSGTGSGGSSCGRAGEFGSKAVPWQHRSVAHAARPPKPLTVGTSFCSLGQAPM